MADFIQHEACPYCGSRDNLARYSDGSAYCFGCCRYIPASIQDRIQYKKDLLEKEESIKFIGLPYDYDPQYQPKIAIDWMEQFQFNRKRMLKYRIGWSESQQRLIFPILQNTQLLAWQGRSFEAKPKWKTIGSIHEFLYVLEEQDKRLVLVEDIISAYNVNEAGFTVAPLFGSHVTPQQACGIIKAGYTEVIFWLDADKYKEAVRMGNQLGLYGISTSYRMTDLDPKLITDINGVLQ